MINIVQLELKLKVQKKSWIKIL